MSNLPDGQVLQELISTFAVGHCMPCFPVWPGLDSLEVTEQLVARDIRNEKNHLMIKVIM